MKRIITIISVLFIHFFSLAQQEKPLFVFDFGLNKIPIPERTRMLVDMGYAGVTFGMKNEGQREKYRQYMATPEAKAGKFSIPVVYFPYNFKNDPAKEDLSWQKTLATPTLEALWVILSNRGTTATPEQGKALLGRMADQAEKLGKDIIIYPHYSTLIESVEEAIPYIQDLNRSNIYLSMHSCHEMRAGNGGRMLEVAIKAAPYLKFVSIAGSDVTMHAVGTGKGKWGDAIKPLDEGDYDMTQFLSAINNIAYDGEVILHTFGIKQNHKEHLSRSLEKWNEMVSIQEGEMKSAITNILDAPENAYYDPISKSWFISSLGGGKVTIEKDGYGWITRLDENGKIISNRWVEGLDAPTGMASYNGFLYVADRGVLVKINIESGNIIQKIKLPGARFPNDVAVTEKGDIYVSETYENSIYKINTKGKVEIFIQDEKLECPNGLWVDGKDLIVATWGPMTNEATFETSRKGTIKKIDLKTREITSIGKGPIANFDGIVKYKKHYYATDWTGGRLLKISKSGEVSEVITGFNQLADLGINLESGLIGVPEMSSNRIFFINLQ